ncbi:putative methyltransferase tdiE [Fusarium culmorum]|uniref:Putative methyltransferase tdiE n=1 Tax=Fusarium culmorum TaxID=5516 RepID=A0A2T4GX93_FUSCU|nr:putative methyltransferase tdiE [Fusarium culmorum]
MISKPSEEPNRQPDNILNPPVAANTPPLDESHLEVDNGRRYHAFREGTYLVPNDEEEQDRMDLVHHIYSLILDEKLHLARLIKIPSVYSISLRNPPNCTFEVDDYEDEWVYRKEFDFIHARELEACVGDEDLLLQRAFQHTRSEGYIELQGVAARFESDDGTIEQAPNAQLWMKNLIEACAKFGKPVDCADKWGARLKRAGFVDVHEEIRKLPIGAWPKDSKLKELGRYQAIQELKVIDSYTPKLFQHALGWKEQEIQVLMAQVKKELRNPSVHLYLPVYIVWGRKP